jgi:hypothetical protein
MGFLWVIRASQRARPPDAGGEAMMKVKSN